MAKKVSKHSRAARRGHLEESHEAKELKSIPKDENSDVKKSIIRTTIKNENLLAQKMENLKVRKNKKKTSSLKHKVERSGKLDGVLSHKIEQSIARAKFVQTARKSGWDKINKGIIDRQPEPVEEKTADQMEDDEADAEVAEFYGERPEEPKSDKKPANLFSLLEEEDA